MVLVDHNLGQAPFLAVHKNYIPRKENLQGFLAAKLWLRQNQKNGKHKSRLCGDISLFVAWLTDRRIHGLADSKLRNCIFTAH